MNTQNVSLTKVASTAKWRKALKDGWPAAKPVLELLVQGVKNPILKVVLSSIITLADSLVLDS